MCLQHNHIIEAFAPKQVDLELDNNLCNIHLDLDIGSGSVEMLHMRSLTSLVAKFSLFVVKITFMVAEITFNMAVMTSSVSKISSFVAKVTFVVAQISYEMASVGDSQLVPMSARTTNRCQLVPQVMSTRITSDVNSYPTRQVSDDGTS